ncbi:MAG: response regulator [Rhodospirillales bacterium]|nr:response regulator [Rhodospirillales bacterium]
MDDLLSEFLTETSESFAALDGELAKFEQEPNNKAILQNIFRLLHTIKGTCGFLGLPRLERIAHAGEDVLGKIREGALAVTPAVLTLVLKCLDVIRDLLAELATSGAEPPGNDRALLDALQALPAGAGAAGPATPRPSPDLGLFQTPLGAELNAEIEAVLAAGRQRPASLERFPPAARPAAEARAVAAPQATPPLEPSPPKDLAVVASGMRVNVEAVEDLMALVSELVLTRNQILQMVRGLEDNQFSAPFQRLSHVTADLQEGVLKTRMQPIGDAWAKLPRIVRDLATESGKKIELVTRGAETELDRQVLELIKDPLTHMVRNSADHGLELPALRRSQGKPEVGTVTLHAFREGGHAIVEVTDDGRGLDMDRIRARAVQMDLASDAELRTMGDSQIQRFIFNPGFSTAETVTGVSGRGVGLNVVRANIERIGGYIDVRSRANAGTTFTMRIPSTLVIVGALIVTCDDQRFAIPEIAVLELVRTARHADYAVEMINNAPVLRLRNRLLPLVSLRDLLKLDRRRPGRTAGDFIVVTRVGTATFGLIVDYVFDTEEIVVKPLAPALRRIPFYSGNTILGDGSVIMILDPDGIAAAAAGGQEALPAVQAVGTTAAAAPVDEKTLFLTFRAAGRELKAVPLALVSRIEEIDMARVETSDGRAVVQYGGRLMPLIPFAAGGALPPSGLQPSLVFSDRDRDRDMALVVDEIVDIVEDRLRVDLLATKPGLLGGAVIAGKVTDVIDAAYYLTQAFPDWFAPQDGAHKTGRTGRRVLLVDDSPFFRNLLSPILSVAGWTVTTAESVEAALRFRDAGAMFDVIVSDIEMPGMDGFALAAAVREDSRWQAVPLVALSSHAAEVEIARARSLGFSDYVAKSDRETLLTTLAQAVEAAAKEVA